LGENPRRNSIVIDGQSGLCLCSQARWYLCCNGFGRQRRIQKPVEVGELVSLHASINYVGRSSLIIGIRVIAENIKSQEVKHTNTSYFTMVAKDEDGKPTEVPGLILESDDDIRRFLEAIRRKEIKNAYKGLLDDAKTSIDIDQNLYLLQNERCIVKRDRDMESLW
jgi:hypothetical protein